MTSTREELLALSEEEQDQFWQWCSHKKHYPSLSKFGLNRRAQPRGTYICRPCDAERMWGKSALFTPEQKANKVRRSAEWREKSPDKYRQLNLNKYGITIAEYDAMLEEQGGVCKACGEPETAKQQNGKVKALTIDHCHAEGHVRGLLCARCNLALGYAREDVKVLIGLINYIEGWPA